MTLKELKDRLNTRRKVRQLLDNSYAKLYDSNATSDKHTNSNNAEFNELKKQADELNKWYIELLNHITADDEYIANIIHLRYSRGFGWDKIALIMGGVASESCYRVAVDRYLKKYLQNHS